MSVRDSSAPCSINTEFVLSKELNVGNAVQLLSLRLTFCCLLLGSALWLLFLRGLLLSSGFLYWFVVCPSCEGSQANLSVDIDIETTSKINVRKCNIMMPNID